MSSRKETPVPRPEASEPVDLRAALAATLVQQRFTDQAVLMLRGAVEAEGRLRGLQTEVSGLEARHAELTRELPTLVKRVEQARAEAQHAETRAREAYAPEAEKVRAAIDKERTALAALLHDQEAKSRELETAYHARQKQLADETGDAERRLAAIRADLAAVVERHRG